MVVSLPDIRFFLFGMGPRRKLLYRDGALIDARSGVTVKEWRIRSDRIDPAEYRVLLDTDAGSVVISEDDTGVHVEENGVVDTLTSSPVNLPDFAGHRYRDELRILHQEILINIVDGRPLPNLFVYDTPWYRDAAMMAFVLEITGNTDMIRDWVLTLDDVYDRNNGVEEPDNLGQLLYLLSLFTNKENPLVHAIRDEIPNHRVGNHIIGLTDGGEKPVYQTKWLKFGLRRIGASDEFVIPAISDPYSALFWWDYTDQHEPHDQDADTGNDLYPYLTWARDHFFHRAPKPEMRAVGYPLTWEAQAGFADYEGMRFVDPAFTDLKLSMPHTWHSAEMFLYYIDRNATG